ncbi:WXG100 family type VII secretion target [Microbacterium sp. SORGH_AS_0888]|uniref:WXG100 family type VII secretion target n=1 Tax=Microbacterium sp. SORGH_AS_0888 TaxID=3041791 RepID=UPI002784F3FE|nr:WXG100 family type VII secretion target [Microbacterium sp. SORGH_AS_0888]MDQ1130592.1 WXG100 family type VII secretion target [Microbacterium sp. SORGH_AS_0888]
MTISFDPDRHDELIRALARAAREIRAELDTLDSRVSDLTARWSGEAQTAYDRAHREWTARMASLQAVLQDAVASGTEAGALLATAEADATAVWT